MKKGAIIGIIVGIIIVGIIAISSSNFETNDLPIVETPVEVVEEETTVEVVEEETTGRNITVELSEKMGLRSP